MPIYVETDYRDGRLKKKSKFQQQYTVLILPIDM